MFRLIRPALLVVAVLALDASAVAQAPPPQVPQPMSPRQWTVLRLPEYGFSIEFPAPANEGRLDSGEIRWAVELDNGWTAYIVSTSEIPLARVQSAGPLGVLDGAVKGGLAKFPDAVVLADSAITIGGSSGRAFTIRIEMQGTPLIISSRVVLVQQRLYVYTAVVKTNHDQTEVDRFLKSFSLISQ